MLDDDRDRWKYASASMPFESAYIVVEGPDHNGTRLALREGITSFGRLPSNDVILLGDLVSRHHARIVFFDGKASIQDLGSHNGSWVNGERITTRPLNEGDVVRIGNFRISIHAGAVSEFADDATGEGRDFSEAVAEARREVRKDSVVRAHQDVHPETKELTARPRSGSGVKRAEETRTPKARAETAIPDDMAVRDPAETLLVRRADDAARGADQQIDPRLFEILFRITEALAKADDVKTFLDGVLTHTLERVPSSGAAIVRIVPGDSDPVTLLARPSNRLKTSSSVVRLAITKGLTVYSRNIAVDIRFKAESSAAVLAGHALLCAPIATAEKVWGAIYLERARDRGFHEGEVEVLEAIGRLAAVGVERIELRERVNEEVIAREALARFHSPDVVDRVLSEAKDGLKPVLEARTATVLIADIPGFSELADELEIHEVSDILNDFVETMAAIVLDQRGAIRPLAGEAFLAAFGAPFSHGNDAVRALRAAVDMREAFDRLVQEHTGLSDLRLRVAVSTGEVLAGMTGSPRRLDYTVLGAPVRFATRLSQAAKGGMIVLDEATYRPAAQTFTFRRVGKQPTQSPLYELLGRSPPGRASSRLAEPEESR